MVQLATEQRVFVAESYIRLKIYAAVQREFRDRFPEREPPAKRTIQENVMILTIYAKEYLRKLILLGSHLMSSELFGQWKPVVDVVLNVMVDMSKIN